MVAPSYLFTRLDIEGEVLQHQIEARAVPRAVVPELHFASFWPSNSRLRFFYLPRSLVKIMERFDNNGTFENYLSNDDLTIAIWRIY